MWNKVCIFNITSLLEVFSSNNFKLLLAGLMSEELHELLAWHSGLKMGREKIQPEDVVAQPFPASSALPPVVFAFLQRSVQSFLNPINTYSGWVVVLKAWGFGDDQHCFDGTNWERLALKEWSRLNCHLKKSKNCDWSCYACEDSYMYVFCLDPLKTLLE